MVAREYECREQPNFEGLEDIENKDEREGDY